MQLFISNLSLYVFLYLYIMHRTQGVPPDLTDLSSDCNPPRYVSGGIYDQALTVALNEVVLHTPQAFPSNFNFELDVTLGGGSQEVIYTVGRCYERNATMLTLEQCRQCISIIRDRLYTKCRGFRGGQYLVSDCFIRYNNTRFPDLFLCT